jgi:hypothetical protein
MPLRVHKRNRITVIQKRKTKIKKINRAHPVVPNLRNVLKQQVLPPSEFENKRFFGKNISIYNNPDDSEPQILYLNNVLEDFYEDIKNLDSELTSFGEEYSREVNDSRGPRDVIYLGTWVRRYHTTCHRTPQTKIYGEENILKYKNLWKFISEIAEKYFPKTCSKFNVLDEKLKLFGIFSLGSFNITSISKFHIDRNDAGICVTIPTCDMDYGEITFPLLNLKFQLRKGDLILYDSSKIIHNVNQCKSIRHTLNLTTQKDLIANGINVSDWRINKI